MPCKRELEWLDLYVVYLSVEYRGSLCKILLIYTQFAIFGKILSFIHIFFSWNKLNPFFNKQFLRIQLSTWWTLNFFCQYLQKMSIFLFSTYLFLKLTSRNKISWNRQCCLLKCNITNWLKSFGREAAENLIKSTFVILWKIRLIYFIFNLQVVSRL